MKKSRFSDTKIISMRKNQEAFISTAEVCLKYGFSKSIFKNWSAKYGGMGVKEIRQLKVQEVKNVRLKKMFAMISMELADLREIIKIQI